MAKIKGICKNFGECELADSHEIQEADKSNFVCEDCGGPLYAVDSSKKSSVGGKVNGKLIGIIAAAVLLLGGIGFGIYSLFGGKPEPTAIKLNFINLTMTVGEQKRLTASLLPETADQKVTFIYKAQKDQAYKDGKEKTMIVKADNATGMLTALRPGVTKAQVICKEYPKLKAICNITVRATERTSQDSVHMETNSVIVEKIMLSAQRIEMKKGEKKQISYTTTPEKHDDNISSSSSNKSVADITASGEVVAKNVGMTTITYRAEKSGVSASVKVIVKDKPGSEPGFGTVKLNYGTYTGDLKNGLPHGHGTVKFTTTRRIVGSQDYIAHPGDRYEGEFRNGVISGGIGYWYHNGEITGIRP